MDAAWADFHSYAIHGEFRNDPRFSGRGVSSGRLSHEYYYAYDELRWYYFSLYAEVQSATDLWRNDRHDGAVLTRLYGGVDCLISRLLRLWYTARVLIAFAARTNCCGT